MKSRITLLVLGCWLTAAVTSIGAQELPEDKIKKAIARGVDYLRKEQRPDGSWEFASNAPVMGGGWSCLAMLGLIHAGVPLNDRMMQNGLAYVRKVDSNMTYVRALQTMVLARAGNMQDQAKVKQNVDWLIEAAVIKNGKLQGWGYGKGPTQRADGSNTQFAVMGLVAGKHAGIRAPQPVWHALHAHYVRTQEADGGWSYVKGEKSPHGAGSNMTMTVAGVNGLILSGLEIQEDRDILKHIAPAHNCGLYKNNVVLVKGLKWLDKNFTVQLDGRTFYNLWGLRRLGELTGYRSFGGRKWYREGCTFVLDKQAANGSWVLPGFADKWENVSTSMALIFLSR